MTFFPPDHPSLPRKVLLAPATALYASLAWLHRTIWLRPARADQATSGLPLIVIGSLRAGGAGKTPVTLEITRWLCTQGYRVGVLAYALRNNKSGRGVKAADAGYREVFPDSDWRETSDEAVLLARALSGSGARVFVTRHRAKARSALARGRAFDVLVCDDGLMDARLGEVPPRDEARRGVTTAKARVLRVALVRPGENPSWTDLLPAGPYRLTTTALRRVDVELREGEGFTRTTLPPAFPHPFVQTEGHDSTPPVWVLTGLGHPGAFLESLRRVGITIMGRSIGPDHGVPSLRTAKKQAQAAGTDVFVCSAKDAIKLEGHPHRPENLFFTGESVTLSEKFLARVTDFLSPPTS